MQYLGGKSRIAKDLSRVMLDYTSDRATYIEPFVGAGSVAAEMAPHFDNVRLNDASPDLIELWRALQNGWIPPESVSEDEYKAQRNAPTSALRGFVGYGCSFGGKWFGGYARNKKGYNYAAGSKNRLILKMKTLQSSLFTNFDYQRLVIPPDSVVYCDPPYANTTKYAALEDFDSEQFWEVAAVWAERATVFVSEYKAPEGWVSIWSGHPTATLKGATAGATSEHLWVKGA